MNRKSGRPLSYFPYFLALILFLLMCSCSLPRILVLEDPLTPEEHINLGVTYEKKGEFENAVVEYEKAAKKLPAAYVYIGNVYFQQDRLQDAEAYYRKAVRKDPENGDAFNNLAWLYYTKKDNLEEAERLALKAIELDPSKEARYRDTLQKIRTLRKETGK